MIRNGLSKAGFIKIGRGIVLCLSALFIFTGLGKYLRKEWVMEEYHKIKTVFKRDPETKFKTLLMGAWALPEFEYLIEQGCQMPVPLTMLFITQKKETEMEPVVNPTCWEEAVVLRETGARIKIVPMLGKDLADCGYEEAVELVRKAEVVV